MQHRKKFTTESQRSQRKNNKNSYIVPMHVENTTSFPCSAWECLKTGRWASSR